MLIGCWGDAEILYPFLYTQLINVLCKRGPLEHAIMRCTTGIGPLVWCQQFFGISSYCMLGAMSAVLLVPTEDLSFSTIISSQSASVLELFLYIELF